MSRGAHAHSEPVRAGQELDMPVPGARVRVLLRATHTVPRGLGSEAWHPGQALLQNHFVISADHFLLWGPQFPDL